MSVAALRKSLLLAILVLLGVVLCLGDNHVCVQSGVCFGCVHAPVWIVSADPIRETRFMQVGLTTTPAEPKSIPLQVLNEPSLRAPPQSARVLVFGEVVVRWCPLQDHTIRRQCNDRFQRSSTCDAALLLLFSFLF